MSVEEYFTLSCLLEFFAACSCCDSCLFEDHCITKIECAESGISIIV